MDNTGKSILIQVSHKGQIEIQKALIISGKPAMHKEIFEKNVWDDYQMLTGLINRAINDEVSNDHIMLLERLIDNSTLDPDQRVKATERLTPTPTYANFVIIRDKLLANQQS